MHRLISPEPVTPTRLGPNTLQITTSRELLRAAVLERQVAQLPTFRCPAVLGTEALRCLCDLTMAAGKRIAQRTGHRSDLEVAAVSARALLDRVALPRQLLRQCRAVERAHLTRTTKHRPGGDRDDPVIVTHRARDHDMRMQLRVRRLSTRDTPRRRVAVCGRDQILRRLLDDLSAVAAAHHRHPLTQ